MLREEREAKFMKGRDRLSPDGGMARSLPSSFASSIQIEEPASVATQ